MVLDEAEPAGGGAEGDQVLAEQPDADRRAVGLRHLARKECRDPVLPDQGADRRVGADATEELVVFLADHGRTEPPTAIPRKGNFTLPEPTVGGSVAGPCASTASRPSRSTFPFGGTSAAARMPSSSAARSSPGCAPRAGSSARSTTVTTASRGRRSCASSTRSWRRASAA